MSAVLKLVDQHQGNAIELVHSLRVFHHSIHQEERAQAIEILGSLNNVDAARELIQIFSECQWRATKLQIIKVLAKHPTQRSLEFLFKIAQENKDIPMAEAAILSLGQTHHVLASRFLINMFQNCAEYLKPFIVTALGYIPDRTLLHELVKELSNALLTNKTLLIKNLTLALGELKAVEATPTLLELAKRKNQRDISLSALMSLGKILRDPKVFEELEVYFKNDSFEYQIYLNTKNQVQFRSEWKLEDYLQKLFDSPKIHPNLPFELNAFDPNDVKEGLKLFTDKKYYPRMCLALAKIDFMGTASWYRELFNLDELGDEEAKMVLASIGHHHGGDWAGLINHFKAKYLSHWIEAVSLCLPSAETVLKNFVSSSDYQLLLEEQKISAINHFANFALTIQGDSKRVLGISKIFENMLDEESSKLVQARLIRAIGQIGKPGNKVFSFIKQKMSDGELLGSCLYFLEMCPDKQSLSLLMSLQPEIKVKSNFTIAFLKALSAQSDLSIKDKNLEVFVSECFVDGSLEAQKQALVLLAKYPSVQFKPALVQCLKSNEKVKQLHAIIALKSLNDESVADDVAGFLKSEVQTLKGRALDTLISLPGNRAKRLVIDHLKENALDIEVCEKIVRSFVPPEGPTEYFLNVVSDLIQKHPEHILKNDLLDLKDKLSAGVAIAGGAPRYPTDEDIAAIDRKLASEIPFYSLCDESAKTALRSAELPFHRPEMFDVFVDKSSSILGYSKAIDIILEKHLGRKILVPRLETKLHEFQNIIHTVTLNEDYPSVDRVLKQLSLERAFSAQSLPLHKMTLIAKGILNTKIVNEQFKILDGLRAWAIMLLIFARKTPLIQKPLIPNFNDEQATIQLAKQLMWLQDLRNPVAHRQTLVEFKTLEQVKVESQQILKSLEKLF